MRQVLMFLPPNIRELSLFAYEKYLEQGRGFIFVKPKDGDEQDFDYTYVNRDSAESVAAEPLELYNPDDEIVFVINQPGGSLGYTIQRFTDKSATPKYLYELKTHPIIGTPQD